MCVSHMLIITCVIIECVYDIGDTIAESTTTNNNSIMTQHRFMHYNENNDRYYSTFIFYLHNTILEHFTYN